MKSKLTFPTRHKFLSRFTSLLLVYCSLVWLCFNFKWNNETKILAARFVSIYFKFRGLLDTYFIYIFLCGMYHYIDICNAKRKLENPNSFAVWQQGSYIPKLFCFYHLSFQDLPSFISQARPVRLIFPG